MPSHVYLFSGASAVGKTAVLSGLLPLLQQGGQSPCVCKIDCLKTADDTVFHRMGLPCVTGLSEDICPDHFLVSNLPELLDWADRIGRDTLVIETAGLCHRCSPATEHMTAGCVLDCTASCRAPGQLGPMLTAADFVVLTKIDMVSQAELEIISWQIRKINPSAVLFPVDGLAGYGTDLLAWWLQCRPACSNFEGDLLRRTMPGGVCSYCIGERRVGTAYQQGIIGKMSFPEDVGNSDDTPALLTSVHRMRHTQQVDKTFTSNDHDSLRQHRDGRDMHRAYPDLPDADFRKQHRERCDMHHLLILPGQDKDGRPELFSPIRLERGRLYTIVGNTGSGKSRLIKDVEQLACGDSVTLRHVLPDGKTVPLQERQQMAAQLVAHLGQNMRFVLDTDVEQFLLLHARSRGKKIAASEVLALANEITPEPIGLYQSLNQLSGGQSRALMVADIAKICDSPVILIDEIENAGIDKEKALRLLCRSDRLVLAVTHDPHTALMSEQRIVMRQGAVAAVLERSTKEAALYAQLDAVYRQQQAYRSLLRKGDHLA